MEINIYNTRTHSYMTLNLSNMGFNDYMDIFESGDEPIRELPSSSIKMFNEIYPKYRFTKSGDFLGDILCILDEGELKSNSILVYEVDTELYYSKISEFVFIMLEGFIASNKFNISVSQKALNLLND